MTKYKVNDLTELLPNKLSHAAALSVELRDVAIISVCSALIFWLSTLRTCL